MHLDWNILNHMLVLALSNFCASYVEFGPMFRTADPDEMKKEIAKIRATGGGDLPEMCLSGLQVLQWWYCQVVTGMVVDWGNTFQIFYRSLKDGSDPEWTDRVNYFISPVGSHRCPCLLPHLCFHWCYSQRHRPQGHYCCSHQELQVHGKYWLMPNDVHSCLFQWI